MAPPKTYMGRQYRGRCNRTIRRQKLENGCQSPEELGEKIKNRRGGDKEKPRARAEIHKANTLSRKRTFIPIFNLLQNMMMAQLSGKYVILNVSGLEKNKHII